MKTAFIYSDDFEKFAYHDSHPLKPIRFKLTYELARAYGLFRSFHHRLVKAKPCTIDDLIAVHSIEYIEAVEHAAVELPEWDRLHYGLDTPDNPIIPQAYEWSLLAVAPVCRPRNWWNPGRRKLRLISLAGSIMPVGIALQDFAISTTSQW